VVVIVRGRCLPVALGGPALGPLVRMRTDHRRELGHNQRLMDRLDRLPDPAIVDLGGFEYLQDVEQGRLV